MPVRLEKPDGNIIKKGAMHGTPLSVMVVLFKNLDDTVTFHIAVVALAGEAVEIGAGRRVAGGGVPELVVLSDVGGVEDARAPFVVDVKLVDGVSETLDEVLDDEAVVDAVTVGSDNRGEL